MIPITRPELPPLEDYARLLEQIWDSRMLSNFARFAQELEVLASTYVGAPTLAIASGDIALTLAIKALDLEAGSRVLVPSFTFNSTINAVIWNGLVPVFTDIDRHTFNLDPTAAAIVADEHHPALLIATHVFGNPADADGLRRVADEHGARLVFDAAHGYGSLRGGVHVGALGDVETFSLSGTKPVTSGEGGLVSTTDPALQTRLRYLRAYGFQADYNSIYVGLNGKMSEFHAALGVLSLARIEAAIAARAALVDRYLALLAGLPLTYQRVRPEDRSTYKDFAVVAASAEARTRIESVLTAEAIQTKRYFRPCHLMPAYSAYPRGSLTVTDDLTERVLCLPAFESLALDDQARVAQVVRRSLE